VQLDKAHIRKSQQEKLKINEAVGRQRHSYPNNLEISHAFKKYLLFSRFFTESSFGIALPDAKPGVARHHRQGDTALHACRISLTDALQTSLHGPAQAACRPRKGIQSAMIGLTFRHIPEN